jgi:metallo-beta-lactamase family protein
MGKHKIKSTIKFLGSATEGVTGSQYLVENSGKKILLECGGTQTNNIERDYQTNSRQFDFKPSELDYVFLMHMHTDHSLLIPKLVKEGFRGNIIVPKDSTSIIKIMLEDSAHIIGKDCEYLNKSRKKNYKPIYNKEDVEETLGLILEYDMKKKFKLDEFTSFEFYPSQHVMSSAQILLYLKNGTVTKKIHYTSDLGNIKFGKSVFTSDFVPVNNSFITIGECTYSAPERSVRDIKDREKDLEKLKSTIDQFVIENKSKILIPVFAFHRAQMMLKFIYDIYKDSSEDFDVVIDSPMAIKITNEFSKLLKGKERTEYKKMLDWKRLKFVDDYESSKACISSDKNMVVLSASGMLSSGRSINHLQGIIEDPNACVLLCGYASPSTLAGQIKEGTAKEITFGGKTYKNKVQLVQLRTMSSHMQYDELLDYYSDINTNQIYLVHANNTKYEFAQTLEDKCREKNKSTRVFVPNIGDVIEF